jgi:predicted O-linked N-acetylglucosamine transferase (SPINDLY family)
VPPFRTPLDALRAGHLPEAERLARMALKANAADAEAHHVLGTVAFHRGDLARAAECYARALAVEPVRAEVAIALTETLRLAKRFEEAVEAGERATALAPDSAPAWNNFGLALDEADRLGEAEQALRRALELDVNHRKAHLNLGNVLRRQKRYEEAEASLRRAIELKPDYHQAWNSLGVVLGDLGRFPDASQAFHEALRLVPRYTKPLTNLGKLLLELERFDEALRCFEEAERRDPKNAKTLADALVLQAQALHRVQKGPEALERLRNAARAAPEDAAPHFEAGSIEFGRFQFDRALEAFRRASERDPKHVAAKANLLFSKAQVCDWSDWEAGVDALRALVANELAAGRPSPLPPHSSIFFPFSAAEQLAIARRHAEGVAERVAKLGLPKASPRARANGERVRVGYLSMDYRDNALAHLARRLFALHDRSRFEAIALSFGPDDDSPWRAEIERTAERFVDLEKLATVEAARRIRALELDLLVDFAGFAGNARPEIVALRPAPLQALWLYPATGGGVFHDLLLADATIAPAGEEPHFGERLVRLPHTFQLTDPDPPIARRTPSRAECGLPATGFVFCAFNQYAKIEPTIFALWMRLLARVPGSALWLQALIPAGRENLKRHAAAHGIDPARLVFAPLAKKPEHLARHAHADLFLDTRYCNAHTTASDALAMGVPLVTCPWPTYAGRVAASVATAMGFSEMIVGDLDQYEELAFALATDAERRRDLRQRLVTARPAAPLFDTKSTVAAWEREVEAVLAGADGRLAPLSDP